MPTAPPPRRPSWPRWCLVLAAAMLCIGCVACEPLPGADKPHRTAPPRPQLRTNLRPGSVGSRLPLPVSALGPRPPTRASASPTSPFGTSGTLGGNKPAAFSYQRTTSTGSTGSSGYGSSRSPSLSPPFRPPPSSSVLYPPRPGGGGGVGGGVSHNALPAQAKKRPPCDCDCLPRPRRDLCAKEPGGSDLQTFINECQLGCHNCTMKKNYQIIAHVACESLT